MLKRRAPRVIATGFLLAATVSGLAACRTAPNVAAYVGETQVSVAELENAVEDRLADEAVAAFAATDEDGFTRRVLSLLVQKEVYAEAAERYGVEADNDDVRARIDELLGDDDPEAVFAQLAQQGIGREDLSENIRQQLLRQRIAESEGRAEQLDDAALQARYEQVRDSFAEVSVGYIVVPDQAIADTVLAQLTADPAAYPAVAAQYPNPNTLPALEMRAADQLPPVLAEGISGAAPNTGFTTPVPETGGVVVTFVEGRVYPPFEEVRPQLEQQAAETAAQAGAELVDEVRSDLGVTVNPRFGVLDGGQLVPADGGVVDILGDEDAAGPPPAVPAD